MRIMSMAATRRRGPAAALALRCGVGVLLLIGMAVTARAATDLDEVQRDLPDFRLTDITGEVWTPASLEGKPWIINFWATWCPPCVEEMPSMNAAWQQLEDQGVGMLAINSGEGLPAVEEFLGKLAIDFPVLLGDGASTLPDWSVNALPTTLVVDASGQVVYEALGPREWDDEALLQQVLDLRQP